MTTSHRATGVVLHNEIFGLQQGNADSEICMLRLCRRPFLLDSLYDCSIYVYRVKLMFIDVYGFSYMFIDYYRLSKHLIDLYRFQ